MKPRYRIRWGNVQVCNGYSCRTERRCIAESKVRLLWFEWWWPVRNSDWRVSESEAEYDIQDDLELKSSGRVVYYD